MPKQMWINSFFNLRFLRRISQNCLNSRFREFPPRLDSNKYFESPILEKLNISSDILSGILTNLSFFP